MLDELCEEIVLGNVEGGVDAVVAILEPCR
jgi:hypothetical protein